MPESDGLQVPSRWFIIVLVFQFWLSGLWILSLIFTTVDTSELEQTNLMMFVVLGVGSLAGGWASDKFGRVFVFKIGSALWFIGSIVALFNSQFGYIVTAGCIGLLNNLTFVLIMENFTNNKDIYTIYVLIGWAVSQITLGVLFYIIQSNHVFFFSLYVLTLIYTASAFKYIKQKNNSQSQLDSQNLLKPNAMTLHNDQNVVWYKKILPHSLRPLIGGCVLMFVMQMFYYRTQFTLDRFGISLQLNTIVVGLMQLTANAIFTKFINKFPRKIYLRVILIFLVILFLGLVLFKNKFIQTVIQGIMRLLDTCIMIILGVYLPQLFQTDERGKGINYIMSFGVLGSALNSIILNTLQFWQLIFFLVLGFFSTFFFKQTFSSHLQTQIKENN